MKPAPESPAIASAENPNAEPDRVLLHMPVDVRSASLVVIATLMALFALHWASAVFIPLMLGLILSYAFSPLVDLLARWKVPRPVGAAIVIAAMLGGLGFGGIALSEQASNLIDSLPDCRDQTAPSRARTAGTSGEQHPAGPRGCSPNRTRRD